MMDRNLFLVFPFTKKTRKIGNNNIILLLILFHCSFIPYHGSRVNYFPIYGCCFEGSTQANVKTKSYNLPAMSKFVYFLSCKLWAKQLTLQDIAYTQLQFVKWKLVVSQVPKV